MSRTLGNSFGPREASAEIVHTYPLPFTAGNDTSYTVDVIHATSDFPVELEISCQVETAFNSSVSDALILTVGGAAVLDSGNVTATVAGYYPASNAVAKIRITADSDVVIKWQGEGDAPTTGHAVFIVKEIVQNTLPVV